MRASAGSSSTEYRLRIINPDAIGTEVRIPDIAMHYRINSKVAANAAVQGRDLLYLPSAGHHAGGIDRSGRFDRHPRRDRGKLLDDRRAQFPRRHLQHPRHRPDRIRRTDDPAGARPRGARRAQVDPGRTAATRRPAPSLASPPANWPRFAASAHQPGWTDELLDRALAATRIAAAAALGRAVNQRTAIVRCRWSAKDGCSPADRAAVPSASCRRRRPRSDLSRQIARLSVADARRPTFEALREALATFTAAQYGRDAARGESALDEALRERRQSGVRQSGHRTCSRARSCGRWTAGASAGGEPGLRCP